MIRVVTTAAVLLIALSGARAAGTDVEINAISAEGTGKSLGSVSLSESEGGVAMKVSVSGVADGEHGFHVHEKGDCGPGKKDGKIEAGLAAGSHYDPHAMKSHKGPDGGGHEGDLPKLTAAGGKIEQTVKLDGIKLADIAYNPESGGGKGRNLNSCRLPRGSSGSPVGQLHASSLPQLRPVPHPIADTVARHSRGGWYWGRLPQLRRSGFVRRTVGSEQLRRYWPKVDISA